MHLIQGSVVCQFLVLLWGALYGLYDSSLLARAVRAGEDPAGQEGRR